MFSPAATSCRIPLFVLLLCAPICLAALPEADDQAPPPAEEQAPVAEPASPIPQGPPPPYVIEADPAAQRQAAEEQAASENEPQAVERVQAHLVGEPGAEPGSRAILSVAKLTPGARPEISRQGDVLAYDKAGESRFRAIYTSRFDGSYERCLTCSLFELKEQHAMAPTWHPRGDLLVVQTQKSNAHLAGDELRLATPARSLHGELWAVSSDGRFGWQLTRSASRGRAVGDPVFSHEGGQLAWSERESTQEGPWGKWVVQVGELKISGGVPRLGKVTIFDASPFGRFVQVAAFTPDDHGLLLIVDREDGRKALGRYDLRSKSFELLSREDEVVSHFAELPQSEWTLWVTRGEVWLVSPSGRGRERLTTFNEPTSRYFLGRAQINELAAGPDGKTLLVDLFESRDGEPPRQSLYLVRFDLARLGRAR